MDNILDIKKVCKKYAKFSLDNISFSLQPGYIMGLIGPNGAGKSTTLRLIMNLCSKDSGSITIFGKDNVRFELDVKNDIGFVFDECKLYENLPVKDMVKIVSLFYSKWDNELCRFYMSKFDIDEAKAINTLSHGMKMKLSIAMALSHDAKLIIMDEPTAGLDPMIRREILDILKEVIKNGDKSVIFSTHITSDLERIADYITFINKGKVVFSKTQDEIFDDFAIIKCSNDDLDSDERANMVAIKDNKYSIEALCQGAENIKRLKQRKNIVVEKSNLEDIMYFFVNRRD